MTPQAKRMLHAARRIALDGGDTDPCGLGAYCLRCCLGVASSGLRTHFGGFSDEHLLEARDLIAGYDGGVTHSRESALAVLDRVLRDAGVKV